MDAPITTLRFRLRDETLQAHQDAEAALDLDRRLASLGAYTALLRALYRAHRPIEARLAAFEWAGSGIAFAERRKLAWLEADLAALRALPVPADAAGAPRVAADGGALVPADEDAAAPPGDEDGPPPSPGEAFGMLYVLEGSTLGGRIIGREVAARLGLDADRGGRFFHGYGARTGAMWQGFTAALDRLGPTGPDADAAVAAARRTFETVRRCVLQAEASPVADGSPRADAGGAATADPSEATSPPRP